MEHNLTFQYICHHSCQSIKSIHDEKLVSNIGKQDHLNTKMLQKQNEEETILKSVELETKNTRDNYVEPTILVTNNSSNDTNHCRLTNTVIQKEVEYLKSQLLQKGKINDTVS